MNRLLSVFVIVVLLVTLYIPAVEASVVYGPEKFQRNTGAPGAVTSNFSANDTHGNTTLYVRNGDILNGSGQVLNGASSAIVRLNGGSIFTTKDFSQKTYLLKRNVSLQDLNALQVEVRSMPGSYLTAWVEDESADIVITSPLDDSVSSGTILLAGNTTDCSIQNLTVDLNGVSIIIPVVDGNFSTSLAIDGPTKVILSARDSTGSIRTTSLCLDGDMLTEKDEGKYGFDPLNSDSDSALTTNNEAGNGVIDGLELLDGGQVPLFVKAKLGCDPLKQDSDKDGLTDYFEIVRMGTLTDPVSNGTENGVSDAVKDRDNDGLTNLQEQNLGTDPLVADTDKDGLSDSYEVTISNSNPLLKDSDKDGLDDDSEVRLSTYPNNPDSNGNGIRDGDETYSSTRTITSGNSNLSVNVTINGRGDLAKNVTIYEETNDYFMNNSALITPLVHFELNDSFDNATITLPYDPEKVSDPSDLAIFYWNETIGMYEPMDTTVDVVNHTVSASTTHFSLFGGFLTSVMNAAFNAMAEVNSAATKLLGSSVSNIYKIKDTVTTTVINIISGVIQKTTYTHNVYTTPTPTPRPSPTVTPTATPRPSPTPTSTPIATPFPTYIPPPVPSGAFTEQVAYVSNSDRNVVSVIDVKDNSIIASIQTIDRPGEITVSSDGNRVYVANGNRVSVIDARSRQILYDIPLRYGAGFLVLSPDNNKLYVSNNGGISCIDLSVTQETGRINGLPSITGMDISKDGNYLFTSDYWECALDVSSTTSFSKVKTIRCYPDSSYQSRYYYNGNWPWNCGVATNVVTSYDGKHVYVSLWSSNDMSIIDAETLTRKNTISLGSRSSDGVTISPDDAYVYASNFDGGSISVVDAKTESCISKIIVGTHPRRLDASTQGGLIYVCLEGGNLKTVDLLNFNSVSTIPIMGNSVRFNPAMSYIRPSLTDTDGDGLQDFIEAGFVGDDGRTYHSDPTLNDTDFDGLQDGYEAGSFEIVNGQLTFHVISNPSLSDSDMDGIDDPDELDPSSLCSDDVSNPLLADTDRDLMNDGRELKYSTYATVGDSDGDGYDDPYEIYNGLYQGPDVIPSSTPQPAPNPQPTPPADYYSYRYRVINDVSPSAAYGSFGDPTVFEKRSYNNDEMYREFTLGRSYGDYKERILDGLDHNNFYYDVGQLLSSVLIYGDVRDANAQWDHQQYITCGITCIFLGLNVAPPISKGATLAKVVSKEILEGLEKKAARELLEDLSAQFLKCGSRTAERELLAKSIDAETLRILRSKGGLSDDEIIDLIKLRKVNVVYLRLMIENEEVIKQFPRFTQYVKFVFEENGDDALQKWLNKRIDGAGSLQAQIKSLTESAKDAGKTADAAQIGKLEKSKMRYVYNIKGGYGEYLAYETLCTKYGKDVVGAIKLSNRGGIDFVFKVTEDGQTVVKVVEVKAKKSLSLKDFKNYLLPDKKSYNINYAVKEKGIDYFRDASGKGLPVEFDVYLYDDNSADLAKGILDQLPVDRKLLYDYSKKTGPSSYTKFNGEAIINIITGSLG